MNVNPWELSDPPPIRFTKVGQWRKREMPHVLTQGLLTPTYTAHTASLAHSQPRWSPPEHLSHITHPLTSLCQ